MQKEYKCELKASELRFGNLIYLGVWNDETLVFDDYPHEVTLIVLRDAEHYKENWAGKPIPLTDDWLRKFGFYVDKVKAHKKYNEQGNIFQLNKVLNGDETQYQFTWGAVDVLYVHHLQNLYFDLTGQELEICA